MMFGVGRAFAYVLAAFTWLMFGTAADADTRAETNVSVQIFHDRLAPYGRWENHRVYGIVWVPASHEPGWHPYTYGRWVWTADYGWYWDSDEEFGWATYHYGRWAYTSEYGWVWVPDDVWGPAWVDWRYSDDYVGWAPMPPAWAWRDNTIVYARVDMSAPSYEPSWVFVSDSDFARGDIRAHLRPPSQNRVMLQSSARVTSYAAVNGQVFNRGVDAKRISAKTKIRIDPVRIRMSETLSDGAHAREAGSVTVYRPRIAARSNLDLSVPGGQGELPWQGEAGATAGQSVDTGASKAVIDHSTNVDAGGTTGRATSGVGAGIGGGLGVGGGGGLRIGR